MRNTMWGVAFASQILFAVPALAQDAGAASDAEAAEASTAENAPTEGSSSGETPAESAQVDETPTVSGDSPIDAADQAPAAEPTEPRPNPLPNEDTESFNLQLRKLQDKVDRLKQRVYDSKARLTRLKEVVMHGAISGAKAVMTHKNEMGSAFRLTRIQYSLDGATIFNRSDAGDGELDDVAELVIFDGSIAPGEHQISVYLEYAGDGFGVFDYVDNYTFKIKSSYTFTAEEGKLTSIDIVGYEKGNFTTELKDRVAVRYAQTAERATRGPEQANTENE